MERRFGAARGAGNRVRRRRSARSRPLLGAGLLFAALVVIAAGAAVPALAQQPGEDEPVVGEEEETEGQESQNQETEGEVGAGEGETEGAAEETGPPWTYQMARLGILLLLVLGGGVAFWYYRLVVRRQRAGF